MRRHAKALSAVLIAMLVLGAGVASALQTHNQGPDVPPPDDGFSSLMGLATSPSSSQLYAADAGANRIDRFSSSGAFEGAGGWGVIASGPNNVPANEHQSLTIDATAGTYVLAYEGEPTADVAFDASAPTLQSALEAIAQIGAGNVSVTGSGPYDIEFTGAKADTDVAELSADPTNLTGGAQSAAITTTAQGAAAFEICDQDAGDVCKAGIPGNGVGQGNEPKDVSVDSSGNFYVADTNNNRISAFDGGGTPLVSFAASGQLEGGSTPLGAFSGPCGITIDLGSGNLFVADQGNNRIWIFDSTGSYEGQIADSSLNGPCGLALTSTGDLYVRNANDGKVLRFNRNTPTSYAFGSVLYAPDNGTPSEEADDGPQATDVAVDTSTGGVYVDKASRISHYDSSGSLLATFGQGALTSESSAAIAVDSSAGKIYAADGGAIRTFSTTLSTVPDVTTKAATEVTAEAATLNGSLDPVGGPETIDCHFEWGADTTYGNSAPCAEGNGFTAAQDVSAEISGLTPGTEYHYRLFVSSPEGPSKGEDRSFATPGTPTLGNTSVSNVSTELATLRATLNPRGAATSYRFEYVELSEFESAGFDNATEVPTPDGVVPAGSTDVSVSQALSGLLPDTEYRYRFLASNEAGSATSAVKSFHTLQSPTAPPPDNCPNAAQRAAVGASNLPDCRAWEMVSPPDKNGSNVRSEGLMSRASLDGDRVAYVAAANFGDTVGTAVFGQTQYAAIRTPGGWRSHSLIPTPNPAWDQVLGGFTLAAPSADVTHAAISAFDLPYLADDMADGINLYRKPIPGDIETISTPQDGPVPLFVEARLIGGSDDYSHVFFFSPAKLLAEATNTGSIYEWHNGTLRLAGVLPDGSAPVDGAGPAGPREQQDPLDVVSRDGSRVLFQSPPSGPSTQLYVRRDASSTAKISESEGATSVETPQDVRYQAASPDLTKIAFTTSAVLTDDDPGGSGQALYIYTDSDTPAVDDNLRFVDRPGGTPLVLGMGVNGSRGFFFIENNILEPRLFLWDEEGVHSTEAPLPSRYDDNTEGYFSAHEVRAASRVSADGTKIAFRSNDELRVTDANLGDLEGASQLPALFVYDSLTDELACASCPPDGAETTGPVYLWPGGTEEPFGMFFLRSRNLSSDGRLAFFSTVDALVPADVNGQVDAYAYDIERGKPHLLSSGRSNSPSWFADASPSGDDAFFITRQSLSGWDIDRAKDMYDARVGGGLPEPPPAQPSCEGDACQPPPASLPDIAPASGSFVGKADPRTQSAKRRCRNRQGPRKRRCRKRRSSQGKTRNQRSAEHARRLGK